jgi:hypothetical protein
MRFIWYFIFIFIWVNITYSQDFFKIGNEYYAKGEYKLADSFLTLHIRQFPYDRNAIFNKGVVQLYLHDTCSFCNCLYHLGDYFERDKQAKDLYSQYCNRTDTIYYDKKFLLCDKRNCRFFEVIEHHKCQNYITGKFHDKKMTYDGTSLDISLKKIESYRTDIFAIYEKRNDNSKVFLKTDSPPVFLGGYDGLTPFIYNSLYFQQMEKYLNIPGTWVSVQFIIDTTGKTRAITIESTQPKRVISEDLTICIQTIYSNLPDFIPGKLKGKSVECYVKHGILFN